MVVIAGTLDDGSRKVGRRLAQHDEVIREVKTTENRTHDWHDQVLDQRINNLAERRTNDDPNRQIHDVALDGKVAKLLHHSHETPLLYI